MIPLSSTFSLFVNHLLAQEHWARSQLQKHSGKVACIDVQMFSLRLKIAADGFLSAADASAVANVTIKIQAADLPLIAQNRERAFSYVKVDGDADLANSISQLGQNLRWEAEEDLSKLFGEIVAQRMVVTTRSLLEAARRTHQNIQENLAEYFLEENPLLVRPAVVDAFGADVNKLRDDVERLMKRIAKLERLP